MVSQKRAVFIGPPCINVTYTNRIGHLVVVFFLVQAVLFSKCTFCLETPARRRSLSPRRRRERRRQT